jgi:PEP-CTERM motif
MFKSKASTAAVLALLALSAQAQQDLPPPPGPVQPAASTVFSYSATTSDAATNTTANQNNLDQPGITGPAGTPGFVNVATGPAQATVWARADPTVGMFKSFAQVSVDHNPATAYASAHTSLNIRDTLRFSGPGSTVDVALTLNWNTRIAGLGSPLQGPANGDNYWFEQAVSNTDLNLDWDVANPSYDPGYVCGFLDEWCQPATLTVGASGGNSLVGVVGWNGAGSMSHEGLQDGTYTGSFTLAVTVPVDTDIRLSYQVTTEATCFYLSQCALTVDASHSDYLGLSVAQGGSFSSASGYQYQGLAAAVPEPGTWALSLLGLAALAARRRAPHRSVDRP